MVRPYPNRLMPQRDEVVSKPLSATRSASHGIEETGRTVDRDPEASRRKSLGIQRNVEKTDRGGARRTGVLGDQTPQEGGPHSDRRPRHPGGAQARSPHGTQSRDRRTDPDQGQQESRLPRGQGTQGSGVTASPIVAGDPFAIPSAASPKAADGCSF